MQTPEINIHEARNFQIGKYKQKQQEKQTLYAKAVNDFERIVKMLIEKYNPQRIYQWGSLLHSEHFTDFSDIDIAVEGINDAETFFALTTEADEMTDFQLDIIQIEKIHILHKEMILKKGKLVYERQ